MNVKWLNSKRKRSKINDVKRYFQQNVDEIFFSGIFFFCCCYFHSNEFFFTFSPFHFSICTLGRCWIQSAWSIWLAAKIFSRVFDWQEKNVTNGSGGTKAREKKHRERERKGKKNQSQSAWWYCFHQTMLPIKQTHCYYSWKSFLEFTCFMHRYSKNRVETFR